MVNLNTSLSVDNPQEVANQHRLMQTFNRQRPVGVSLR